MAIKKVLAAAGVVLVVAPAAAAVMMSRGDAGGNAYKEVREAVANALVLDQFARLLERDGDTGEGRSPQASYGEGKARLLADLVGPRLASLEALKLHFRSIALAGGDPFASDAQYDSTILAALAGMEGPLGGQAEVVTGGAHGSGSSGFSAAGGIGKGPGASSRSGAGGPGGGSGGASSSGTELAQAETVQSDAVPTDAESPGRQFTDGAIEDPSTATPPFGQDPGRNGSANGSAGGVLASIPLPASVWMLLAAVTGLGFLGRRRILV